MSDPQREGARNIADHELTVEHDDMLFGGWNHTKNPSEPKRQRGVLERLSTIESILKLMGAAVLVIVLHDLGVPTDQLFHVVAQLAK